MKALSSSKSCISITCRGFSCESYTLADGKPQGDILDDARKLDLPAGANRPVWLDINVPADTSRGTYTGTFTARSNSSHLDFPLRLEVLPANLPSPDNWSFHLDLCPRL